MHSSTAVPSRHPERVFAMRDPLNWALPLFRAFGIPVKVHIFFFVVTLGLFFRQVGWLGYREIWLDVFFLTIVVLFGVVLLHEFGHCFGARYVDGEAKEILIWPLGGLASLDVPHTPRANFIATAAGPAMNVVICLVCAVFMGVVGFLPSLNPIIDPYHPELTNFNGKTYTSANGYLSANGPSYRYYRNGEEVSRSEVESTKNNPAANESSSQALQKAGIERAIAPGWVVWLYRIFWVSWTLFLFNLLPAYPLDGGRMLQCIVWSRSDYRRGVVIASYSGFGVSVIFLLVAIIFNEALFLGLAVFMLYAASMALHQLEIDDSPFGYDFSAGYTSLEKDDEPPRKTKKVGWFTRWRQTRRARKMQQEADSRQRDEERMDLLLEKIARTGKESLSDEENRFLERMSARKRNMS